MLLGLREEVILLQGADSQHSCCLEQKSTFRIESGLILSGGDKIETSPSTWDTKRNYAPANSTFYAF